MGLISRLRRVITYLQRPTAIRHGHRYTDHVTGERFDVETVGRWVEITRLDAERRPEHRVRKARMRTALNAGVVEHDSSTCPSCDSD